MLDTHTSHSVPVFCLSSFSVNELISLFLSLSPGPGGGVLPYMGYIGMCRCEGFGFQAVYSSIGCINQSVGSRIGYHVLRN